MHLTYMEPDPERACETINPSHAKPPPSRRATTWTSAHRHFFAASVMIITSSMVSTFWIENPLPFCSRYWMLIGGTDECFWRPYAIVGLAAYIAYLLAALWWYEQHKHWPHQPIMIALALSVGMGLSLALKADLEHIVRNTLTWSIFAGLVVCAVMNRRQGSRGGSSEV